MKTNNNSKNKDINKNNTRKIINIIMKHTNKNNATNKNKTNDNNNGKHKRPKRENIIIRRQI